MEHSFKTAEVKRAARLARRRANRTAVAEALQDDPQLRPVERK
jgi:hypothetical protein